MVLDGAQLQIEGVELPALWRWFDRSQPIWSDRIGRIFCHCVAGPIGLLDLVWQDGRESVVTIGYQQRRRQSRGDEMLTFRALMHREDPHCAHGSLLMHVGGSLDLHCRTHDLVLTGDQVVRCVGETGGWAGSRDAPQPRRVVCALSNRADVE